jgi:hypothetical protein
MLFLLTMNGANAQSYSYNYESPTCTWNFVSTQDGKVRGSCTLKISAAWREPTFEERTGSVLTMFGALGVAAFGGPALATIGLGATQVFVGQQLLNILAGSTVIGTALTSTGLINAPFLLGKTERELDPVELSVSYDIADVQGTKNIILSLDHPNEEIPIEGVVFNPDGTYKFHIHVKQTGPELTGVGGIAGTPVFKEYVYEKADSSKGILAFSQAQVEWNFYYDWDETKLKEVKTPKTPDCELIPDKNVISGKSSVKFTVKLYSDMIQGQSITHVEAVCGDTGYNVPISNMGAEFTCNFKGFKEQTAINSVAFAWTDNYKLNGIGCSAQVTAYPDPNDEEVIAESTSLPSNVRHSITSNAGYSTIGYGKLTVHVCNINSNGYPISYIQGAKVYFVTDYLYLGDGITDLNGEVPYAKSPPYNVELPKYYVKLPTDTEVQLLVPQIENMSVNEIEMTSISGVTLHQSVTSPVVLSFDTDKPSNCSVSMGGLGSGMSPRSTRIDSSSDGLQHTITLTYDMTGGTWSLVVTCISSDGKYNKIITIPSLIITSLAPPDVPPSTNIKRVNVNGCQIYPDQACGFLGWGDAKTAVVHGNSNAYIEAVVERRGIGPFFVRYKDANTGTVLYETSLPNPTYLWAASSPAETSTVAALLVFPVGQSKVKIEMGHVRDSQEIVDSSLEIVLNADSMIIGCGSGATRCSGNIVQKCDSDFTGQMVWKDVETCEFGCIYSISGAECASKQEATGSCYLGANPNYIKAGENSMITLAYSGLNSEPDSVSINCGNGQTVTTTCSGTSGTCSAVCNYPVSSLPTSNSYRASATASGIVCRDTEVSFAGEVVGQTLGGIYLDLRINGLIPTKVGDEAYITLIACKTTGCLYTDKIEGLSVTLFINGEALPAQTTDSTGSALWRIGFDSGGRKEVYAEFGNIQSNKLTLIIEGPSQQTTTTTQSSVSSTTTTVSSCPYLCLASSMCSSEGGTCQSAYTCTSGKCCCYIPSGTITTTTTTTSSTTTSSTTTTTVPASCQSGYTCYGSSSYDCITYCGTDENVAGAYTATGKCNAAGNTVCCKCVSTVPAEVFGNTLWDFIKGLLGI